MVFGLGKDKKDKAGDDQTAEGQETIEEQEIVEEQETAEEEIEEKPVKKSKRVPVFAITAGDPFVDGVVRSYENACKNKKRKLKADVNARPFILEADDRFALSALRNYVQRAAGAGDSKRVDIAKKAIETFEAFAGK